MFNEISKTSDLLKEKALECYLDKTSVFHFFKFLESSTPKKTNFNENFNNANNVYFERNSLQVLDLKNYKKRYAPEKLIEYIKKFIDTPFAPPFINYIGTMHLMEILIRSIFFFIMNPQLSPAEKEMLLNTFTWMIVNSYQNLFEIKNRHWKVTYYFRALLKYLFFEGEEEIKSYDENKDNIKNNIKSTYNTTTDKIKSILHKDITYSKSLFIFPNNIANTKIHSNKPYLFAPPFFITSGREFEKYKENLLILYVAIAACNCLNDEIIFDKNIILDYKHLFNN